jgi:hypothetical protein
MTYDELAKGAAAAGFRDVPCHLCRGKGITVRSDARPAPPIQVEDPCPACDGLGRLWQLGKSPQYLTDTQLAARLATPRGRAAKNTAGKK